MNLAKMTNRKYFLNKLVSVVNTVSGTTYLL